jgi:PAS domain S-box-containing protein
VLAEIVDTIPTQLWSARADGTIDFLSRRWLDYAGVSAEQAPGWDWTLAVHPDDRDRLAEWSRTLLSSGTSRDTEARLRRADGDYRWFLVSGHSRRDASGAVVGWCAVNTDIDDRKRAEDVLGASEHAFRLIVDNIPGQVVILDKAGGIELVNDRILNYFGRSLAELREWTAGGLVHPEDLPRVIAHWQHSVSTGEPLETEHRLRRADGIYHWFQMRGLPLRDSANQIVRWYCLITDIHDRKMAEEALQRSEAFLLDAQRLSRTGSWRLDLATGRVHSSPEILRAYGLGPDDEYPEPAFWFDRIHDEDRDRIQATFVRCVSEKTAYEADYRIVRVDGATSYQHAIGRPVLDQSGQLVEFVGASMDVTEHALAKADLERASEALRTIQTKLSRAAKIATVSELAASIAHEVNQPLAAVVANGHACLRWLSATPPNLARAIEAADRIVKDGKDAGEVIRRVRSLFKRADAERVPLDINEVIREVLGLVQTDTRRKGVTLQVALQPDLPPVRGDRVQLQQLVLNLMLNALDAVQPIDNRPRQVSMRSKRHHDQTMLIEVEDNGDGVEDLDKPFEPFYTTKAEGMGMGLAICRSIVSAHQGTLAAARNDDVGMTFQVVLPLQPEAP